MDDDPKPPPPPPDETWAAIALRDPYGLFLARGITWRVAGAATPFQAETWPDEAEMRAWMANRLASFRRDVHNGGYVPVRLACRAGAEESGRDERRPVVAEAVCSDA